MEFQAGVLKWQKALKDPGNQLIKVNKANIDPCSLTCHLPCFDPVQAPLLKAHKKYFLTIITDGAQDLCRKSW